MATNDVPAAVAAQLDAARRVMQQADTLAALSASPDHIERCYLTEQHAQANQQVGQWMQDAGLTSHTDAVGNIVGVRDTGAPTLIIGSHLDTIPNAGRYDGILGVLCGVEMAAQLPDLPLSLEIIGFGEEEGVRFGTTLICSRGRAGTWDPAWADIEDADGVTVASAMQHFGLTVADVGSARPNKKIAGFLELHIEQGPVLEDLGLPVGVVTGIAGAKRFSALVTGQAGHAGTVPMNLRRDAVVGSAECIRLATELAVELNVVATVGRIEASPGAVNVIAGQATFSLDVRSIDDQAVDRFVDKWQRRVQQAMQAQGLTFELSMTHNAQAVQCAPHLQQAVAAAISELGIEAYHLPSGAGHDAMAMAHLTDVGMIFMRCKDGLSHHPDESVTVTDVAWGLATLKGSIENLARN